MWVHPYIVMFPHNDDWPKKKVVCFKLSGYPTVPKFLPQP